MKSLFLPPPHPAPNCICHGVPKLWIKRPIEKGYPNGGSWSCCVKMRASQKKSYEMAKVRRGYVRKKQGRPFGTHCRKGHPYDEQNTYVNKKTGVRGCRTCRARYKRNAEIANPNYWKDVRLRSKYGITLGMFDEMYAAQKGLCAICRKRQGTAVDHNHLTGKIRGLLCVPCNAGLGNFKENTEWLQNAMEYLKHHQK